LLAVRDGVAPQAASRIIVRNATQYCRMSVMCLSPVCYMSINNCYDPKQVANLRIRCKTPLYTSGFNKKLVVIDDLGNIAGSRDY
jgi:hypothetical protein